MAVSSQDENYHVPMLNSAAAVAAKPRGKPLRAGNAAKNKYTPYQQPVYCSAFGYGNATAAVNDPTVDTFPDQTWEVRLCLCTQQAPPGVMTRPASVMYSGQTD